MSKYKRNSKKTEHKLIYIKLKFMNTIKKQLKGKKNKENYWNQKNMKKTHQKGLRKKNNQHIMGLINQRMIFNLKENKLQKIDKLQKI